MRTRALLLCLALGSSCQSAPQATTAEAPPAPPVHPFAILESGALKKEWKRFDLAPDGKLSSQELKDAFLEAYSSADRSNSGTLDGFVDLATACAQAPVICKETDANADGKLAINEFLDKVDALILGADANRDRALQGKELDRLEALR